VLSDSAYRSGCSGRALGRRTPSAPHVVLRGPDLIEVTMRRFARGGAGLKRGWALRPRGALPAKGAHPSASQVSGFQRVVGHRAVLRVLASHSEARKQLVRPSAAYQQVGWLGDVL